MEIECGYNKTLPIGEIEKMKKNLVQYENSFEKFQNLAKTT